MLITQQDILECNPPFVMNLSDNTWRLVAQIALLNKQYCLTLIEKTDGKFKQRTIELDQAPFYVGEDVWELDYGSTLMTLIHASLNDHPARQIWQEYLENKKSETS